MKKLFSWAVPQLTDLMPASRSAKILTDIVERKSPFTSLEFGIADTICTRIPPTSEFNIELITVKFSGYCASCMMLYDAIVVSLLKNHCKKGKFTAKHEKTMSGHPKFDTFADKLREPTKIKEPK